MKRFVARGMLALAALSVLYSGVGWAAEPWLSAPSALKPGDRTEILGGNLPAGAQVLLTVAEPVGRNVEEHVVNVDANGNVTFALTVQQPGHYLVEVRRLDAPEALSLAHVDVMVAPQLAPAAN